MNGALSELKPAQVISGFMAGCLAALIYTNSIVTHSQYKDGRETAVSPAVTIPTSDSGLNLESPESSAMRREEQSAYSRLNQTNILDLVDLRSSLPIPVELSKEESKSFLFNEYLPTRNALVQGSGPEKMYIFFDALCKHCHNTYRFLDKYKKYVTVNWIPAVGFLESTDSLRYGLALQAASERKDRSNATAALNSLMSGSLSKSFVSEFLELISEQTILDLGENTGALLQISGGTAASVFKDKNGDIVVINGELVAKDIEHFVKQ